MSVVDRITTWSMGIGVQQLALDPNQVPVFRFADHLRHLFHHVTKLRKTPSEQDGVMARHLVACSRILSTISFEASLLNLDIDHNEVEDIQYHIRQTLNTILDADSNHFDSRVLVDSLRELQEPTHQLARQHTSRS